MSITPTTNRSQLSRGYTIALASAAVLSSTAIFIRYLTETYQMPALVLAFLRDVFVAVVLLLVLGLLRPKLLHAGRQHLPYLVVYGLALAVFNAMWTLSVAHNGAALSTVLVYSSAAFTALLGWWLLNERLTWVNVGAILLSMAGVFLVSGALDSSAWRLNLIGILTGILSGLLFAIYSLMGRSASQRGINPWTTLLYTFGFAAVFLLVFNLLFGKLLPGGASNIVELFWLGNSLVGWGILLLLAAVPTLGGFGLYNVSLGYLPSSTANLILTTEPVFTIAIAYVLLDERLNASQLFGGALIMAGVFLLRIYGGRQANHTHHVSSQVDASTKAHLPKS